MSLTTPETEWSGIAVVTPYVQPNGVLMLERRYLPTGVVSQWCPVAEPAWDGYVPWPANLPRWAR